MNESIKKIVETCKDYREDDNFQFDENHVIQWINQFPEGSKNAILKEMKEILEKTYISKNKMFDFFNGIANYLNEHYSNKYIQVLDCQTKGNSQSELCKLFNEYLVTSKTTIGSKQGRPLWLYLDDFIFTGNTAIRDIERINIDKSNIVVAVIATHSKAEYRFGKQTNVILIRAMELENSRLNTSKQTDIIWPSYFENRVLNEYINHIEELHKEDRYETKDLMFRHDNEELKDLFNDDNNRKILEKEFILNGINLINQAQNPNKNMKPLGYDYKKTLGFGSTLVSFRNCANNCPMVMWYGETDKIFRLLHPDSPLSKWYPLFPRKTNKNGGLIEL